MGISKELKRAICNEVEAQWKRRSDLDDGKGWGSADYGSPRDKFMLHQAGVKVNERTVEQNGVRIATIHRRYSQRKVRLYYPELKPKIEWEVA